MILEDNQVEAKNSILDKLIDQRELVLYNDDVNTFDHVILSLIKYCDHTAVQAEQCAHLVHYKGKCAIKLGTLDDLKPMCEALLEKGLSAEIE
mgnify:CR=1 FL=1